MTLWIRYKHRNSEGFGVLERETINVFEGDIFSSPSDTGDQLKLNDVEVLTPTVPKKIPTPHFFLNGAFSSNEIAKDAFFTLRALLGKC